MWFALLFVGHCCGWPLFKLLCISIADSAKWCAWQWCWCDVFVEGPPFSHQRPAHRLFICSQVPYFDSWFSIDSVICCVELHINSCWWSNCCINWLHCVSVSTVGRSKRDQLMHCSIGSGAEWLWGLSMWMTGVVFDVFINSQSVMRLKNWSELWVTAELKSFDTSTVQYSWNMSTLYANCHEPCRMTHLWCWQVWPNAASDQRPSPLASSPQEGAV